MAKYKTRSFLSLKVICVICGISVASERRRINQKAIYNVRGETKFKALIHEAASEVQFLRLSAALSDFVPRNFEAFHVEMMIVKRLKII